MTPAPDDEVDFGRYWAALAARWWLLLAGLLIGALVGFLVASGSKQVSRASVTVFLGQPLSASGGAPIQTLATNPSTVRDVIHSTTAIDKAAKAAGVDAKTFSTGISQAPVAGFVAKLGQTPLIAISVKGDVSEPKLRVIVTSLARTALSQVSGYVDQKVSNYHTQLAQDDVELAALDLRIKQMTSALTRNDISPTDKLVLVNLETNAEQRRTNLRSDELQAKLLLAQSQAVEQGHLVGPATSVKTTARSRGNAVAIGALIGLVIAAIVALFLARRWPA
jgi:uncharacterized protein involved in exopolysaccharide biosynthesis